MRLIDSHAHLDFADFDNDREEVLRRAGLADVATIVNVGTDLNTSRRTIELASTHPQVFAAVGVHPHEADSMTEVDWTEIEQLADHPRTVAIGETGLDYFRDRSGRDRQLQLFERHLELAHRKELPVIVHCREAHADVLTLLEKRASGPGLSGVMHCFSGDERTARRCMEMGLYISFSGTVTFPNATQVQAAACAVPVERMLVETDSPYLAPQQRRGKRNEPAFVTYVARKLAELKGLSPEDLGRITTFNAGTLFGLGLEMTPAAIAYPIRNSLYLNITNRCSNECTFCVRARTDFVKGHNLRLVREPEETEILKALETQGLERYDEVVFCGYGEPTERLETLKRVAGELKRRGKTVRLVTNGQGELINRRRIVDELTGLVDRVSVSLNTASPEQYDGLCRSRFGKEAFAAVLDFTRRAGEKLPEVEVTAVGAPEVDVEAVKSLAAQLGVKFRRREYNEVG